MQAFFNKLGNESKGGFGAGKPPFWERPTFLLWSGAQPDPAAAEASLAADEDFKNWKTKYDRSRRTVTRTGKFELGRTAVHAHPKTHCEGSDEFQLWYIQLTNYVFRRATVPV